MIALSLCGDGEKIVQGKVLYVGNFNFDIYHDHAGEFVEYHIPVQLQAGSVQSRSNMYLSYTESTVLTMSK